MPIQNRHVLKACTAPAAVASVLSSSRVRYRMLERRWRSLPC